MGSFITFLIIIFIISLFSPRSSAKKDTKLITDDKKDSSTTVKPKSNTIEKQEHSQDCKNNIINTATTCKTTNSIPRGEAKATLQGQCRELKERIESLGNDGEIRELKTSLERPGIITPENKQKSDIEKSSSQRTVVQCPGTEGEKELCQQEIVNSLKFAVSKWPVCRQGTYHVYSFFKYYPTSVRNIPDQDMANRKAVWCFKDGDSKNNSNYDIILNRTLDICYKLINNTFGNNSKYLTLFCIPASSRAKNELRYRNFSNLLCAKTNMINSFNHVYVTHDGNPKHISYFNKVPNVVNINRPFFKNKNILIFDDIITKGVSIVNMGQLLESTGATVIGALTLGVTCHTVQGFYPIYPVE